MIHGNGSLERALEVKDGDIWHSRHHEGNTCLREYGPPPIYIYALELDNLKIKPPISNLDIDRRFRHLLSHGWPEDIYSSSNFIPANATCHVNSKAVCWSLYVRALEMRRDV